MFDLAVRNGNVYLPGGAVVKASIGIKDGKIVSIGGNAAIGEAAENIDATGLLVIPGGFDSHVHIHPRVARRGDFKTGSLAAIAGGTTLVADFARAGERESLVEAFRRKVEVGLRLARCDFCLHTVLWRDRDIGEVEKLARMGALSYKHMMANCDGTPYVDTGFMYKSFLTLSGKNLIATVHAEDEWIRREAQKLLVDAGRRDPDAHWQARPDIAQVEAVKRAILLATYMNVRLHIFHLSTARVLPDIVAAKQKGVTVETCPHYLIFTREDVKDMGPFLAINPPLGTKEDRAMLWKALADGTVDIVTSDHYAPLREEKEKCWDDIWNVEAGVPGVETRLPLMLSEGYLKGRLTLKRFVDAVSTGAARIYRLYPLKGAIIPGADADLTIINLKDEYKLDLDMLHQKADWTPYEGLTLKGRIVYTIVSGSIIYERGELQPRGKARLIPFNYRDRIARWDEDRCLG